MHYDFDSSRRLIDEISTLIYEDGTPNLQGSTKIDTDIAPKDNELIERVELVNSQKHVVIDE